MTRTEAGYTLVEVMVAVAIMTVGSLGVLALHEATTVGNLTSRDTAIATGVTRTWIERLERESLSWTAAGHPPNAPPTRNLTTVPLAPATPGAWAVTQSTDAPGGDLGTFDQFGVQTAVAGDMRFCTQVRFQWVVPNQAIRADVRTHFARNTTAGDWLNFGCGAAPTAITAELASATPRISAVYGSTVLRWTRLGP
jgi:prepilin-type N-terminal cleavage/methylation domain-containing protein